jgi:hypothetical protein
VHQLHPKPLHVVQRLKADSHDPQKAAAELRPEPAIFRRSMLLQFGPHGLNIPASVEH